MACQKVCKALSLHLFTLQLQTNVKTMREWNFVNLPSLLYHPYILFGMPSLHPSPFVMFFKSCQFIWMGHLLPCNAKQKKMLFSMLKFANLLCSLAELSCFVNYLSSRKNVQIFLVPEGCIRIYCTMNSTLYLAGKEAELHVAPSSDVQPLWFYSL